MKKLSEKLDLWGTALGALTLRVAALYTLYFPPFDPTIFTMAIFCSGVLYLRMCILFSRSGRGFRKQIIHASLRAIILEGVSALCAPKAPFDNPIAYWGLGILSFAFCVQLCNFICLAKGLNTKWRFLGLLGLFGAVIVAIRKGTIEPESETMNDGVQIDGSATGGAIGDDGTQEGVLPEEESEPFGLPTRVMHDHE